MSAATAKRLSSRDTSTTPRSSKPKLTLIASPQKDAEAQLKLRHRRNLLIATISFMAGLFAITFAHAQMVTAQYELDQLKRAEAELATEMASLEREVEEASAPGNIVFRAEELGMVRATESVYLTAVGSTSSSPTSTESVALGVQSEPGSTSSNEPAGEPELRSVTDAESDTTSELAVASPEAVATIESLFAGASAEYRGRFTSAELAAE